MNQRESDKNKTPKNSEQDQSSGTSIESTPLIPGSLEDPKGKIEEIISELPEPKRREFKEYILEFFMGVVERGGPKIDPETAGILTASLDKDNENKFKYLSQKQQDEAERERREHAFKVRQFNSRERFLWLIVPTVLLVCVGGIIEGIYLATHGHDTLGVSILSAIITGIFAYLAGVGTANFFKHD